MIWGELVWKTKRTKINQINELQKQITKLCLFRVKTQPLNKCALYEGSLSVTTEQCCNLGFLCCQRDICPVGTSRENPRACAHLSLKTALKCHHGAVEHTHVCAWAVWALEPSMCLGVYWTKARMLLDKDMNVVGELSFIFKNILTFWARQFVFSFAHFKIKIEIGPPLFDRRLELIFLVASPVCFWSLNNFFFWYVLLWIFPWLLEKSWKISMSTKRSKYPHRSCCLRDRSPSLIY